MQVLALRNSKVTQHKQFVVTMQGRCSTIILFEQCKGDTVQLVCLNKVDAVKVFEERKDDAVQVVCLKNARVIQYK